MVEEGKTVRVHYKGTLNDGTVFDSSEGGDPLEFQVGIGMVIPGFDAAIQQMEVGENQVVNIPCDQAYGKARDDLIGDIPRDRLPENITPEVGMQLAMQTPQGQAGVRIVDVKEDAVCIDANHELAGQDLTFDLTLVEIV